MPSSFMNRRVLTRCMAILLLCAADGVAVAGSNQTVRFVTDAEKRGGFLVEITRAALERVGYAVDVQYMSWNDALTAVMDGKREALLGAQYRPERAKSMQYTERIGGSALVFFKLKRTKIKYEGLTDLRPYTIGTIVGGVYPAEFESANYLKKQPIADYDMNIRKLRAGSIDLMLEKRGVVLNTVVVSYPQDLLQLEMLSPPLSEVDYFNAFSRKYSDAKQKVEDFNRGLKLITKEGIVGAILKRRPPE
ncbi:substrate-binding periplasmic protein [Chitinimonas naiadis]